MAIDKIFDGAVDGIADNLFNSVSNSVSEIKAMQQRKAAENVQLVVQALKKIDNDIREKYDVVTETFDKRIASIKDGRDGIDGKNGRDGLNGKDGRDGKDGRNGRDGATGPRGFDGPKGLDGKDGQDGEDGVSVEDAHIDFDGSLIITLSSGRVINVGEVVAADIAEKIKVITNGGGTSQPVLDELASLQAQINLIASALVYKGTWNASTNTPTLTSSVGTANTFYIVSVAGTTNLNGTSNWGVGDWAVYNGTVWQRVEGGAVGNFTDLSVSGTTTLSGLTASTALALNASKEVVSVTNTGSGNNVLATSPTLTTPNLGTPSSVTLTNGTGLPLSTGVTGTLPIANGGTGQTTATNAFNALAPSQASNSGKYLTTNGTTTSWATVSTGVTSVAATVPSFLSVSGSPITSSGTLAFSLSGTALPTSSGGTGLTSFTNKGVPYATSTSALTTGTALQFDGNNLGVSTTPSAWSSAHRAIEIGNQTSVSYFTSGSLQVSTFATNIYNVSTVGARDYYKANGVAAKYIQSVGEHAWLTAPSGTAGSTTTIVSGNTYTNLTAGNQPDFGASDGLVGTIWTATSSGTLSSGTVVQNINFVESMRIDTSSNVGIGTSTPGSKLDLKGTLRLSGSTSGYVGLAPASAAGSTTYTLPSADGTNGQALTTNGSGTLSWATAASGTVTSVAMTVPSFLSVTGSPITSSGTLAVSLSGTALPIANGGTGQTTANAALNALLPSQTGNGNKYLQTNGTDTSWDAVSLSTADITGTLGTGNGGTGLTAFTLNGVVYATSTSALATGNALQFDGTNLLVGTTTSVYNNAGRSCIELNGSTDSLIAFKSGGTSSGYLVGGSATLSLYAAGASTVLTFGTNGQERLRIDASGNAGLGVSPSSWTTAFKAFQIGATGSLVYNGSTDVYLSNNYANIGGSSKYITTAAATLYQQGVGVHAWYNAPSGTSGNAITFTQAMTLDASGRLGIGETSPTQQVHAKTASTTYYLAETTGTGTSSGFRMKAGASADYTLFTTQGVNQFAIYDNVAAAERLHLTSAGNLGLGVTPSAWATLRGLQNGRANLVGYANNAEGAWFTNNAFYDGSGWKYQVTAQATLNQQLSGVHAWFNAPSGTAGNAITWTQAMTLTAAGNLGLGTTSPAAISNYVAQTINGTSGSFTEWQQNGSNTFRVGTDSSNGGFLFTQSASPIRFGINGADAARIDSSGNMGIGETSPSGYRLNLKTPNSQGILLNGTGTGGAWMLFSNNGTANGYIASAYHTFTSGSQTNFAIRAENNLVFGIGASESARIDSSGNLLVGTTAKIYDGKISVGFSSTGSQGIALIDNTATTGGIYAYFINSSGNIAGSISHATTTTVLFNTTSDYRLKNVIGAVSGSGERIDALEPIEYEWKEDGKRTRGFLAHKFQEVYADSVTGTKDAVDANGNPVYQAMQASSSEVIADLVAEIQLLRKRLADAGI